MKIYDKEDIIFRQGDFAGSMFDILSGSVGVYVGYGTENETQLAVLKAGQFLGEMGLIDVYPRSATAVALEDGTALEEITEKEFSDYFNDRPERLLEIMRQLSDRVRNQTKDYEAACRILESMRRTQDEPEKRSVSLAEQVKKLLDSYNKTMNLVYLYSGEEAFLPYGVDEI